MSRTQIYTLVEPVGFEGRQYHEVVLRRAKGRDVLAITKASRQDEAEAGFLAIALLADVPRGLIDEMDAEDIAALTQMLPDFLPKPRGSTPQS